MYDLEPIVKPPLACEQALLFGRAKRVARETGEAARGRPPSSLLLSLVHFSRYPSNRELAHWLNLL